MSDVNCKAFIPEEVEAGLHLDLLNYLLTYNSKSQDYYYDIHCYTDGYCTIIEWVDRSYTKDIDYGQFTFVDCDHHILKEVVFPDNHIEYLEDDDEPTAIEEWLKENPGWELNSFGHWYYPDNTLGEKND